VGELDIWRMRPDGSAPEQVTRGRAEAPSISPDGQWLYFTKEEGVQGLWRMPISGGPETLVVEALFRYNYAVTARGVYYAATPSTKDQTSTVRFLDFATGKTSDIAPIDRRVDLGLAVSPDGRYLLFTKIDYLGRRPDACRELPVRKQTSTRYLSRLRHFARIVWWGQYGSQPRAVRRFSSVRSVHRIGRFDARAVASPAHCVSSGKVRWRSVIGSLVAAIRE
jgi:hypothetical protein